MNMALKNILALSLMQMLSLTCQAQEFYIDSIRNIKLPIICIETLNNEEPTCDYVSHPDGCFGESITNATKVPGRLVIINQDTIYDSHEYRKDVSGITINIRGNTSAYNDKKSFKIKLQNKQDLLFRGNEDKYKDKNWLLLPESIYTMIGLNISKLFGMPYTPSYIFTNLVINGDYRGTYMLIESIKRNTNCRIDVSENGYIIERDPYWWNENVSFSTNNVDVPYKYTFQYPDEDEITSTQINHIQEYLNQLELSISTGTYQDYIDVPSFAAWLLVHDILGDKDCAGSNIFLTKYDDSNCSKIKMGPLWDFGAIETLDDKWSAIHDDNYYFKSLLNSVNSEFLDVYRNLWREKSPIVFDTLYEILYNFIDSETGKELEKSKLLDQIRWNYKDVTFREDIEASVSWFSNRRIWLENAIPNIRTDIESQNNEVENDINYDLAGHIIGNSTGKVCTSNPQIYITNGKKYLHHK